MVKHIKKLYSIISTILIVIVVSVAFLLVGIRLIGLVPYTVLSGSMEPKYHVGSIIYVTEVEPEEINIGDPLTFRISNGTVVTHAVVEIIEAPDPVNRQFVTQGLANDTTDGSPITIANIIGKPVFSIPYLGYVSNYVQNPPGIYVAICFVFAVLLLSFVPDVLKEGKKDPESLSEKVAADVSEFPSVFTETSSEKDAESEEDKT